MTEDDKQKNDAIALSDDNEGPITTTELALGLQQIGRATDALVRRVAGGTREPSEHILDDARREFQEETMQGQQINILCDRCGVKSPGAVGQQAAERLANSMGWFVSADKDFCPVCKDQPRLLPGEVSKSANDEQLPIELSIKDQIFLTRLDWIIKRIDAGATAVASILNARRSGHRSMLTDLGREFGYDAGAFFLKVATLIDLPEARAFMPHLWLRSPSEGGDEVHFVENLFRLIKAEDGA